MIKMMIGCVLPCYAAGKRFRNVSSPSHFNKIFSLLFSKWAVPTRMS
jgi:hypothetical protein